MGLKYCVIFYFAVRYLARMLPGSGAAEATWISLFASAMSTRLANLPEICLISQGHLCLVVWLEELWLVGLHSFSSYMYIIYIIYEGFFASIFYHNKYFPETFSFQSFCSSFFLSLWFSLSFTCLGFYFFKFHFRKCWAFEGQCPCCTFSPSTSTERQATH